jgi:hypothetical protein
MMKKLVFIILVFVNVKGLSQNISGKWEGKIIPVNPAIVIRFPVSFNIMYDVVSNSITGTTTTISFDTISVQAYIKGSFLFDIGYVHIEEIGLAESDTSKKEFVRNFYRFRINDITTGIMTGRCFCLDAQRHYLCNEEFIVNLKREE